MAPKNLVVLRAPMLCTSLFFLVLCICFSAGTVAGKDTTMQFYMHDNVFPPNVTAIPVAGVGANSTSMGFGTVTVIDDALTEGPQHSSKPIGRGQGTWIVSALDGSSLLLTFTAVFQTGEFNGSTLSLHGADKITQKTREIAVVGGTGKFRFARGYAVINTEAFTPASVTLKIDITVTH